MPHDRGFGPYFEHAHHGNPLGWIVAFVLFALLFAAAAALLARWLAGRQVAATAGAAPAAADALAVVRMRYARGEIDREQFLQASADLGGAPPPLPG
ncbi:MAG: hypothetical protein JO186_12540 [Actinobacteria bacterium]|nr:hypothetical protein [Actinomycetota bacterium]